MIEPGIQAADNRRKPACPPSTSRAIHAGNPQHGERPSIRSTLSISDSVGFRLVSHDRKLTGATLTPAAGPTARALLRRG